MAGVAGGAGAGASACAGAFAVVSFLIHFAGDGEAQHLIDLIDQVGEGIAAVGQMGNAYAKQNEVVRNTVQINQDIAGSIRTENEQFVSITAMAESNANDIERMTEQITSINDMVEEINNILSV